MEEPINKRIPGYDNLHKWVRKNKPASKTCEYCGEERYLELANLSGEYHKDINDFKWLCVPCHRILDDHISAVRRAAAKRRAGRTHCKNGHELSGDNKQVYFHKQGFYWYRCRICGNAASREWHRRNKKEPKGE